MEAKPDTGPPLEISEVALLVVDLEHNVPGESQSTEEKLVWLRAKTFRIRVRADLVPTRFDIEAKTS